MTVTKQGLKSLIEALMEESAKTKEELKEIEAEFEEELKKIEFSGKNV